MTIYILEISKIHVISCRTYDKGINNLKKFIRMDYPVIKKMPEVLFVQKLIDKALMLKKHLKDTECDLRLVANIGPNMATLNYIILEKRTPRNYT